MPRWEYDHHDQEPPEEWVPFFLAAGAFTILILILIYGLGNIG